MKIAIAFLLTTLLLTPSLAFAQAPAAGCKLTDFQSSFKCVIGLQQESGIKDQEPRALILTIISYALQLVAVFAVIAILFAGAMYLLSAGDEKRAETAKKAVIYAIIGLVLIGATLMIVNLLINALKAG